ncbi:MAG: 2,3-bisphosphoglycerate-independent phosphoglycerate mutase [Candidatus Komeilibacteria bacterium]|nr:2,3-bisphosphoglycerate-independent phosphoglycerate mutase [Candidatus Komeilibacteria bacterium]
MEEVKKFNGPLVLAIFDGWGLSEKTAGNPVKIASMPVTAGFYKNYPHSQLIASGRKVGLPDHQRGNSEAGHLNLGAGRIVGQDVNVISNEIKTGKFFKNPAFMAVVEHVLHHKSQVHLAGLLSGSQSPHVEMGYLYALLRLLDQEGVEKVCLHLFTDGRDAPQHDAIKYLKKVREHFVANEKIATIAGRFYGMDRNKTWDRTKAVYDAMTLGKGIKVSSAEEAVMQAYNRGETDEYVQPSVIVAQGKPVATVNDNDGIIFFNLRSDRARQLSKAFVQQFFNKKNPGSFVRKKLPKHLRFVAMTDFGPDLDHILTAYPSDNLLQTLPMVMKNYKQLYLAETEKYAHVTFFFNGGYSEPVAGEERIVVPSPQVKFYATTPAMSAYKITEVLLAKLREGKQLIVVNFCNPDMIGHTGLLQPAIKAMEVCDDCLGKISSEVLKEKGVLLITADHGNVEEMVNGKTGELDTEHSNNPVPFILVADQFKKAEVRNGILADVAPTILDIFGVTKPKEMTGKSLIIKSS